MGIGELVRGALDLCFPWSCAVCKAGFEGRGPLCATCLSDLEGLEGEPCCAACAMSLPMHGSPCPYCMGKGPPLFERVVRLTSFHDPVRALVHHLKYHGRWGIGEELADRLLHREPVQELLKKTDLVVPVPLHWRRQVTRGYNQAEVLARRLAGKKVVRAVRRVRNTPTQTHQQTAARRAENLRGAFALVKPETVAGKHVVIVDDVWTSGATMREMARAIKGAKPASLSAIVVATADPRGVERVEQRELTAGGRG